MTVPSISSRALSRAPASSASQMWTCGSSWSGRTSLRRRLRAVALRFPDSRRMRSRFRPSVASAIASMVRASCGRVARFSMCPRASALRGVAPEIAVGRIPIGEDGAAAPTKGGVPWCQSPLRRTCGFDLGGCGGCARAGAFRAGRIGIEWSAQSADFSASFFHARVSCQSVPPTLCLYRLPLVVRAGTPTPRLAPCSLSLQVS